ncbi:MAG: alkaline phosphatase family protein [Cyanobacteria bacterium P01_A01_bin.40]
MVIGLDSADSKLLIDWCDSGKLPVLKSLKEQGVWGKLASPPLMADDAAWASFSTSVSPAEHGRFFWKSFHSGSYDTPQFSAQDWKHEPFWNVLSQANKKVAIIDVPKCQLSKDLNGIQLANWLVHGRDDKTGSFPPSFAPDILSRYGNDQNDCPNSDEYLCLMETLSTEKLRLLLQRLINSVERKLSVATEVLNQGNWDLFLTVFKESHCVGHQFWHLLDEGHPQYDQVLAHELGDAIEKIYQLIDRSVGKLLELSDPDTNVIIFSNLGMAANYTGESYLDEILNRLESPVPPRFQPKYRKLIKVKNRIQKKITRRELHLNAHRKAFQLEHNEISGAIRINLKDREPAGRISPGRELEKFCAKLSQDLIDLVDPNTGNPIVKQVIRTETLFTGNHQDCLPDLLVEWRRDALITSVASKKIGLLRVNKPPYRTGNHTVDGIYFARGPAIVPNQNPSSASLMDIGPTIAALLNTSLPDVEGKPIKAICG